MTCRGNIEKAEITVQVEFKHTDLSGCLNRLLKQLG